MKIASVADVKARFSAYLRETESGPVVITRNGRPAAILVNVVDEDELESLLLAHSPKFRAILQAARDEIKQTGGIPHDEFWQQVDAEYDETLGTDQANSAINGNQEAARMMRSMPV